MAQQPEVSEDLVVRYVIDVDGASRIDEAESMLQFDEYADSIRAGRYCEGAIVFEAPSQESLSLSDALPFLVPHLCFQSLEKLKADETVTVPFFMSGDDVVASVKGGEIWLSLTSGGSFHYEKQAMMTALFECGIRFKAFYARLRAGDPAFELDLANIEKDSVAAREVLEPAR